MDIFNDYKEINLEIINSIKEDKEDISLLEKREEIIKKIFSLKLEKSEIKKIYKEKGLDILDKELEDVLKEKMLSVKEEIKQISKQKQANLGYVNANRSGNFFSTKI
ncbi:hypothetical protein [Clostridium taeniosporum]|uniref:Flagellar protein FliT n=1 Tax=Clostridium taeniosporum TaxID=394958 RepID=A0A1D7XHT2_9CLOT|nr:hypothetical protein [Clostridium taeniosporum]AOR22907.1 flagellar protein FliT [Clostridium taeniosporum]